MLTEQDVSKRLGVKAKTLQMWRWRGIGPRFVRMSSRAVRYRPEDVESFVAAHVVETENSDLAGAR